MAAFEDQQIGLLGGRGIGAAGLAVQQRDLAEHLARIDDVERNLLAIGRHRPDADPPAQHRHHRGPVVTLLENGLPTPDAPLGGKFENLIQFG